MSRGAGSQPVAHPERGSLSMFMAAFMVMAVLLLALVVDGGQIRNARRQAADIAQGAARAGAQELDSQRRLSGEVAANPPEVAQSARNYLTLAGATGDVQVDGSQVHVTVRLDVDLAFLDAAGGRMVVARATADATEGSG